MNPDLRQSGLITEIARAIELVQSGDLPQAHELYNSIVSRLSADSDADCRAGFGLLCLKLKNTMTAVAVLKKVSEENPDNIDYLSWLGAAHLENNQPAAAESVLIRAFRGAPDSWTILSDLGKAKIGQRKYQEAIEPIEASIKLNQHNDQSYINLTFCLTRLGRQNDALEAGKKAILANPKSSMLHKNVGGIIMELGDSEGASVYFEKAIKLDKKNGGAYLSLSGIKKFSTEDGSTIKQMEDVLKLSMPAIHRSYINFALAKIYNDIGSWDKAFANLRKANMLRGTSVPETPNIDHAKSHLKQLYTPQLVASASGIGHDSRTPVFIVGMPRSGTTLTEQIIDRHSQAAGAGELNEIPRLAERVCGLQNKEGYLDAWRKSLNKEALHEFALEYLDVLSNENSGASVVTDKLPENFFNIGFISTMFPNAPFIHTTRDPVDTCLSCYFQAFESITWAFDLESIGSRYVLYREVMEFWKSVLPAEKILEVCYEDMVRTPEVISKQVIEHCGLEWEPQCLDTKASERAVSTASVWQVRQPIYKTSVKRWHNYVEHLEPLLKRISRYLTDEDIEFIQSRGIKIKTKSWWPF